MSSAVFLKRVSFFGCRIWNSPRRDPVARVPWFHEGGIASSDGCTFLSRKNVAVGNAFGVDDNPAAIGVDRVAEQAGTGLKEHPDARLTMPRP
jgi:hypothetical protein